MGAVVADFEPGGVGYQGVRAFSKALTQAVLLFGVETWVLTLRIERALISFQHRAAQRLTRRQPRRRGYRSWEYPSLEGEMVEAGFKEIKTYVTRRQNTVAQYIVMRTILYLCEWSALRTGAWVSQRWREQDGLDLEGAKKREAAKLDGEEAIRKD